MSKRKLNSILVTGGSGFIGSNLIRYFFSKEDFKGKIINLDLLTYAGNPENLKDVAHKYNDSRYFFVHGDINDSSLVNKTLKDYDIDTVIHLAAESHVDRSIHGPAQFIQTNFVGTFTLLEAVRNYWGDRKDVLFHHVSTDEVYGSLGDTGLFTEESPYDPRSPYSASKAGSDHLVSAYFHTYGMAVTISNCSNNYGPYQFPEKLIPLMIINMREGKPLPIYGKGENVRDWIYVEDHCEGIWAAINSGKQGYCYNFGGNAERTNLQLVHELAGVVAEHLGKGLDSILRRITFVKDRPGHDLRYAIDSSRAVQELNWSSQYALSDGLDKTVSWYLSNESWIESVQTEEYKKWNAVNYEHR